MSRLPPARKTAGKAASPRDPLPSSKPHLPRPPWAPVHQKARGGPSPAAGPASIRTGLPDELKAGIEALSGIAMDDVRVLRNSAEPAKLAALAFTRGSDIHLGPGQERHLPHEAWHAVQQKQGRVRATIQAKGGVGINDDRGLEREADLMGVRAMDAAVISEGGAAQDREIRPLSIVSAATQVCQCIITDGFKSNYLHYYFGQPAARPFQGKDPGYIWTEINKFLGIQQAQGPKPEISEIADYYGVEAEEPAVAAPVLGPLPAALNFNFDAGHGDLHFIPHPTAKKSAWSIPKASAMTLMEGEMTLRMADIIAAAAAEYPNVLKWILVANSPTKIGSSVRNSDVRTFQIQITASLGQGAGITYHGFPDDNALHAGLGPNRNNLT
ncbi:MAG TPA: DUF4157 domain-containing protein [Allosphingosinicella sp.]|nr:DUF4157 domain-containing protein [Allosphingosinicella sp.]